MGPRLDPKRKMNTVQRLIWNYLGQNGVSTAAHLCSFLRSRDGAKTKTLISFGNIKLIFFKEWWWSKDNKTSGMILWTELCWSNKEWYFGLGTSNGIVLNKEDNTSGLVLRTKSSKIWNRRTKIPWLISGFDPTWKFSFENNFDTLTCLEAQFAQFWK